MTQELLAIERGEAARFVGARTPRKEDPRLLSGQGSYVGDVALPGMGHVAFVRSPYASAIIDRIDVEEALKAPGVRSVYTGVELGEGRTLPAGWRGSVLATEYASFVGEPLVMVIADSRGEAEDAAELVDIQYTPRAAAIDLEAAVAGEVLVHPADTTNVYEVLATPDWETIDAAIEAAPHTFTERIEQHCYVHSPMETRGVLASWQSSTSMMTVWFSTQGAHPAAAHFSNVLGLTEEAVRVVAQDVGGSFGQKLQVSREETAIVIAARLTNRPVKWIEDRYENLLAGPHAWREYADVTFATDDEGVVLAIKVDAYQDCGAYGGSNIGNFNNMLPGAYRIAKAGIRSGLVRTNKPARGPYRGPWLFESVIRETMMDIVARGLGLDPLEIRRRNIIHRSELPYRSATGSVYDLITCEETMERAAEAIDYEGFRRLQKQAWSEGRYLGLGWSVVVEPSAFGARQLADGAIVRINDSGKVTVAMGNGVSGHSIETTMCQIVADELGVDIDDVSIVVGDTAQTPVGGAANGSRNAVSGGNSAARAAQELRAKVVEIAAAQLEADPEDLEISHGIVSVRGVPAMSKTMAEIAHAARSSLTLPAGMQPGLEAFGRFTVSEVTYSNVCHVAFCEVDIETGQVRVPRYFVGEDCGTMINPNVVEGQIAGGVVQGIGGALYEHFVYDAEGNPLTTTYLDYLIPTSAEVPDIEYDHLETPASTNPGGFKGMGEGGAIASPGAVINAVADALSPFGVTITQQPLTPPFILELIGESRMAG